MVVEYIRYRVPAERHSEFEDAYAGAQAALDQSPHCLAYEVSHGIEEPDNYVVRIEWDSLDGHEQGFRRSAAFGPFFAAVRPFFEQIEEMRHYERTSVASGDAR
jgi:heme-degrading monooxygenase HmoA